MLRGIQDPNDPINAEDVAAFEKRHGVSLPEAYRHFLIRYNGGEPIPYPVAGSFESFLQALRDD